MTTKGNVLLFLVAIIGVINIIDDPLLLKLNIENDGIFEIAFESVVSAIELILILCAIFIERNLVSRAKENEKNYRRLIDYSPEAIFVLRGETIIYANKVGIELLGANSIEELISFNWKHFDNTLKEARKKNKHRIVRKQLTIERLDHKNIHLDITATKVNYYHSPAIEVIAKDITKMKKKENEITQLAFYDPLTSLPNRRLLMNEIEGFITKSNTNFAVIFIDLDGFKKVNDNLGHDVGDLLLVKVSHYLKESVRTQDIVSRFAGDEFILLLPGASLRECKLVAQRIIENLSSNLVYDGNIKVTPSMGIALYPQNGQDAKTLLKKADIALYHAKNKGKNTYQFVGDLS